MNFLNHTRIRTRILIAVLIPIVATTYLSFEKYQRVAEQKDRLIQLGTVLNVMSHLSEVINSLQNERELAMIMTGENGLGHSDLYEKSVADTDSKLVKLNQYIIEKESSLLLASGLIDQLKKFLSMADEVKAVRQYVRKGLFLQPNGKFTVKIYNDTIHEASNSSRSVVILASSDQELSLLSTAYFSLMMGKGFRAMNIGIMSRILTDKEIVFSRINRFLVNYQVAKEFLTLYKNFGPQDLVKEYNSYYQSADSTKKISKVRKALNQKRMNDLPNREDWYKTSKDSWFRLAKMDDKVRRHIVDKVSTRVAIASTEVQNTFIGFVFLLGCIVILTYFIIRSILIPLKTLVNNFIAITETNDLEREAPIIGSDEFAEASGAFNTLLAGLHEKNASIQALLSNMQQGLFTIKPDGKVHEEYSQQLEAIFDQDKLANIDAFSLLFEKSNLGSDERDQSKQAMNAIIGEDIFNFNINNHLLIREYEILIGNQNKILALEWNPIVEDEIVEKLMVTVRDVTEYKKMEAEVAKNMREMNIIEQLLKIPDAKIFKFEKATRDFLEENCNIIEQNKNTPQTLAKLFRNMHTIKGNSRTFGFSLLCDITHEAETQYTEISDNPTLWDGQSMLDYLKEIENILNEYIDTFKNVLGRGDSVRNSNDGLFIESSIAKELMANIRKAEAELTAIGKKQLSDDIVNILQHSQSMTLEDMLTDLIASLSDIAEQLDKAKPLVRIMDGGIRLDKNIENFMTGIFTHLLRNSLDHGFETVDQRIEAGKNTTGVIDIVFMPNHHSIEIVVRDDGRGLNLGALYKKGVEHKMWENNSRVSVQQIADLMFQSGTSTKEEVSAISGRGVGMDAVKNFIEENDGSIEIKILDDKQHYNQKQSKQFVDIEFVISLPKKHFILRQMAA